MTIAAGALIILALPASAFDIPWVRSNQNAFATALVQQDNEKLERLQNAYDSLPGEIRFDTYLAMKSGRVVARSGDIDLPINLHSGRKSVLSGLYGIAIEKGLLRLNQSLAELGIGDAKTPLSEIESTATIRDLLMSRSGIYIEAGGETREMVASRPVRGSHKPGEYFYYNNWDFNALGTIFERRTGLSIGQALYEWVAKPTGMKTFEPKHVVYFPSSRSEHQQYTIFMSAADLARFGLLYLNKGRWQRKQIIPERWVAESLTAYSEVKLQAAQPLDHFGYSWWLDEDDRTVWMLGWGGQYMSLDPGRELLIVSRQDTGRSQTQVWLFMTARKSRLPLHHEQLRRWTIQNLE